MCGNRRGAAGFSGAEAAAPPVIWPINAVIINGGIRFGYYCFTGQKWNEEGRFRSDTGAECEVKDYMRLHTY